MNDWKQKTTMTPSQPARHASRLEAGGSPPHEEEKGAGSLNKSEMASIAFQLGFIIAIPVIVFGYFGKWLDQKLDSSPLLTLIGIFTAIGFTSLWIYRKFKSYFKGS